MLALHLILAISINTAAPTTDPRHPDAVGGTWEAQFSASAVHINVRVDRERGYANYGRTFELDDLSVLRRGKRAVGFELRRPAGNFRFDGVSANRRASGAFEFVPNASFKKSAERIGLNGVSRHHQLAFALNDVTIDDLRYLQRTVQGKLTTNQVVQMLNRGATPHYVRDLSSIGFSRLTADALMRTREQGVDADYIRGMRAAGFRLTLDEYVQARDRGVTLDYIGDLKAVGLGDLGLNEVVALRVANVTAAFVRSLLEIGYSTLDSDDLIRLSRRGITASYIKKLNKQAGEQLDVDDLLKYRTTGEY